jgi:hypothetical protein
MILINCQFWEGDKAQAMALARLMADIEPVFRNDVLFMFCARFDCQHDEETVAYVAQKFAVHKYTTKRKATGWPNGPNQMMGDSYEHIVELWRRGKLPKEIDAILLMEADCVPLHKDWINLLYNEHKASGKKVTGAWLKKGDCNCEHVNGNCVISIDFWKKAPGMFHPPSRGGWDAMLKHVILPNAAPSRLIWSDYQLGQPNNPWRGCDYLWEPKSYRAPDNPLFGQILQPAYFHGIKIMSGIECARERLVK